MRCPLSTHLGTKNHPFVTPGGRILRYIEDLGPLWTLTVGEEHSPLVRHPSITPLVRCIIRYLQLLFPLPYPRSGKWPLEPFSTINHDTGSTAGIRSWRGGGEHAEHVPPPRYESVSYPSSKASTKAYVIPKRSDLIFDQI